MFVDNLSSIAGQPYSFELDPEIKNAVEVFKEVCTQHANKGFSSICTTVYIRNYDGDLSRLGFGTEHFASVAFWGVPENMRQGLFERARGQFETEIKKLGFKNCRVECITEGPFYPSIFIGNRKTFLKDKSKPMYEKYLRVTASW